MTALASLISELKDVCVGLPDQRKGPRRDEDHSMADIGLSAFSVFFMGSPPFLAHQRALEEGQGRSNCQTLFSMSAIPSDAYIRLTLDGIADDWPVDYGMLEPFYAENGRMTGVSGLEGDPAYPPKPSMMPPLPLGWPAPCWRAEPTIQAGSGGRTTVRSLRRITKDAGGGVL